MKKLIPIFALLLTVIAANAATYPIKVKGITVTDANKEDILGNGTVKYQDSNNTLFISNANITYSGSVINVSEEMTKDFYINVSGTNTFSVDRGNCVAYTGKGNFTIHSQNNGSLSINVASGNWLGIDILSEANLTLRGFDLNVNSAICVGTHFKPTTQSLTVEACRLNLVGTESAIKMKSCNLKYCYYETHEYAIDGFNSSGYGTYEGNIVKIVKAEIEEYGIKIAGVKVDARNMHSVTSGVSFSPDENELTLNNANITYHHGTPVMIYGYNTSETSKAFKIKLIGTNKIVTEMDYNGLHASPLDVDSTLIYSNSGGILNISVNSGFCALRNTGKKIAFKNCTVNLRNSRSTGQAFLGDEKNNSEVSFINANVIAHTAGTDALRYISALNYYACFMKTPNDAFIGPDYKLVSRNNPTNDFEVVIGKDNISPFFPYENTLTPIEVKAHSAKIKFYQAMDNLTPKKNIKYHIYIAKDRLSGLWEQDYELNPNFKTNVLETEITNLTENQKYVIRLKVTDEAGNYSIYNDMEFTTAKDNAPTLPADHSFNYTTTSRSISLSWNPATDDYSDASKLKYTVEYKKNGTITGWTMPEVGNATSYIIQNLLPNTTYLVDIKVTDEAGKFIRYGEKKITTDLEDAVENITIDTDHHANARNLQGLTVSDSYKGIIIQNGKKYIKK